MFADRTLVIRGRHFKKCKSPDGKMRRPRLDAWFDFGPNSPQDEIMGNLQDCMDTIAKGLNDLLDGKDMRSYENKILDLVAEKTSTIMDIAPGTLFNGSAN